MPTVVFEKAIVTYTFLVDMEALDVKEMRQDFEDFQNGKLPKEKMGDAERDFLLKEPGALEWIRSQFDDPQVLAEAAVEKRFSEIIRRLRPYGVRTAHSAKGKQSTSFPEPPHVTALREQIESGERSERLVNVGVEITRPPVDQTDTGPTVLPFCGFSWLTNQIGDEPGGGLTLLHMTVRQFPA